ncbi:MAG: alpha/beta fold hydrolase [Chloroflexota bacterium]
MPLNFRRLFENNPLTDPDAFDIKLDRPLVVQGVRLSLGEIESLLNQQAEVRQSRVVAVADGTNRPRLVAFIVPARPAENARQLQERLRRILPMHLLPEQFVLLDELPLTPEGEVDESRLPAPAFAPGPRPEGGASQSRGERFLLKLWREILGTDSLGPDDDFFQRGGDERRAAAMLARLESSTRVKLSVEQFREHSRLRDLARLLDRSSPASAGETTVELRPGEGGPIFLIPAAARTSLSSMRYVSRIREGIRVVGLEYPRILPDLPPARRVPALAGYFVRQIRAVQPQGPVSLAGNCMGGIVVYEAARQLIESGQGVESMMMIDCGAPVLQSESAERGARYYARRLAFHLQNGALLKILKNRLSAWFRPVRQLNMDADVRQAIKYLWDAKNAYRAPARYDGSMLIVLNSLSRESQRADAWEEAAPRAEIHYIEETDHLELFQSERALETVGRLMNDYLEGTLAG